ncbi:syntaxin-61-like [Quillaja saponaria]|uniref:Syntaxin-61-like n=1 Tax=Quillaja saponaria TaxID=32244 RepID=A0AAD7LTC9_QUISA|nr:syntaxin-61-like [Quillaja saponaria]
MRYKDFVLDSIVLAGEEYESGSSRDWAAKVPMLLMKLAYFDHGGTLHFVIRNLAKKSIGTTSVITYKMPSAQDPFYVVKGEIQESIDTLQSTFQQWGSTPSDNGEQVQLTKELLAGCESIDWQLDELDKAIAVASRDPSWYGIDEMEIENRRRWTSSARSQVATVKRAVKSWKGSDRSNQYTAQHNDDFIASESDRQLLLIKQQDEELDELSASVQRIGGVGLTIHDELLEQIIDELGSEMDSTTTRLDFVQKKVALVMKKAGAKGQIMLILFLVILFIVLFVLVFFS